MMHEESRIAAWLRARRNVRPPAGFADRVMQKLDDAPESPPDSGPLPSVVGPLDSNSVSSRLLRLAVCCLALAAGLVPFVYVAFVARLLGVQ